MTNLSGKFAAPVSHAAIDDAQPNVEIHKIAAAIPPVPQAPVQTKADVMDEVRRLFGKFWWLWLIVIVCCFTKGE